MPGVDPKVVAGLFCPNIPPPVPNAPVPVLVVGWPNAPVAAGVAG